MRAISLDTETTGGSIRLGDRAIDVGLVEMIDGKATGKKWQSYLNPEGRKSHWGALRVHGIRDSFLLDKPLFSDVAQDMMAFIDGAPCLAHNAQFDRDVVINEFHVSGLNIPDIKFFDTIAMAKKVLKTERNNLDNLVKMLGLQVPDRKVHGALLDAEILAMMVEALNERDPEMLDGFLKHGRPLAALPSFLKSLVHCPRTTNPIVLSMPGTKPFVPERKVPEFGQLNAGVAEAIAILNQTEGDATDGMEKSMRSGGTDGFSKLNAADAMVIATRTFAQEDILAAYQAVGIAPEAKGLRWMCRGLKPDRWAACQIAADAMYDKRPAAEEQPAFGM